MSHKPASLPKECDDDRANRAKVVANLEENAKKMRAVETEFAEIREVASRHLERLSEGNDEITPPPFALPILSAARKKK